MNSESQIPDLAPVLERPTEPELELQKLFRGKQDLTIFDIGACEGEDTIRYCRLFPQSQVYTFEPLPENQFLILENFKRYRISNARLIPRALSNKAGTVRFHVSSGTPPGQFLREKWNYGNKSSSLLPPIDKNPMFGWIEFKKTIDIQCETLEQVCRQYGITHIDFIHMDVQGAESLVLQGAAQMLHRITAIWLEVSERQLYSGQMLRPEIEKVMTNAGFVLVFQKLREVEGDQFYVNVRDSRTRKYLFRRKIYCFLGKVRKRLRNWITKSESQDWMREPAARGPG
jgi:FkbM family methyltransferase